MTTRAWRTPGPMLACCGVIITLALTAALIAPIAAFGHRGFLLLTTGYFVCGFQLNFITVHFPALADRHRFLQPPGRRFPRRVVRWTSVR